MLIGRRDRQDGRNCGGVDAFAMTEVSGSITLLEASATSERLWFVVHSDLGPYLVGAWYRPPVQGEVETIRTLREEWLRLSSNVIGTVIVGDINVHHKKWLRRSAGNSADGEASRTFCIVMGHATDGARADAW